MPLITISGLSGNLLQLRYSHSEAVICNLGLPDLACPERECLGIWVCSAGFHGSRNP